MRWASRLPLWVAALVLSTYSAAAQPLEPTTCCLNPFPHIHGELTEANRPPPADTELLVTRSNPEPGVSPFQIVINPTAALAANPAALGAFQRAADQWAQRISDPITVTINANLVPLGGNTLGQTLAVSLAGTFDLVTEVLVDDALNEADDDEVVAALPSRTGYAFTSPASTTFSGRVISTKANFKAMGFIGLDAIHGASDGTITFNSSFAFDFDNSNGVAPNTRDFETVAAHEIGHVLGFFSTIDSYTNSDSSPTAWDLFRFPNDSPDDPENLLSFRTAARRIAPGGDQIFDDLDVEVPLSTGLASNPFGPGDGFQASHFKADELTGQLVGLMDPSLAREVFYRVTENDLRVLDLIGYEIQRIPEPATTALILFASLACHGRPGRARRPGFVRPCNL